MSKKNNTDIITDTETYYNSLNEYFKENQFTINGNEQAILQTVLTNIGLLILTLKKSLKKKDEMRLFI